jgi:hypothetical protein
VSSPVISFSGDYVDGNISTWEVIEGFGTAIGMNANSGVGSIPSFKAVNQNTVPVSVSIAVTPKSSLSCLGEVKIFTVTVYSRVAVNLGNDTAICRFDSLRLDATHPLSTGYLWEDGSTEPVHIARAAGQYRVTVSSLCGEATDTIQISYVSALQVDLGEDTTICNGDVLQFNVTQPKGYAVSYLWQNGSGVPVYTVRQAGIYKVTVSNPCMSVSDEVEVRVMDCELKFWLPNAFTPDRNMNCIFKPEMENPEYLGNYEMVIYNRWGEVIFITDDYLTGWNGRNHEGKECSAGIYAGVVKYTDRKGKQFIKQTIITLLR